MRSTTSTDLLAGAALLAMLTLAGCASTYHYTPTTDSGALSVEMAQKQCRFETDKVVAIDATGWAVYSVPQQKPRRCLWV